MRRAVFFDRDGVLNEPILRGGKTYAPLRLEDFVLTQGIQKQVHRVKNASLLSFVFTNQPEIARGLLSWETLKRMHERLTDTANFDNIYVCPHDPQTGCPCHKPKPGMLLQAQREWNLDLKGSFVIGDRWRDIGAGKQAGCFSILLERPYSLCPNPDVAVDSLEAAVDHILRQL